MKISRTTCIFALAMIWGLAYAQDTTMTVTATGNMGVGTTNPVAKLHIISDGGFAAPQLELNQTGNAAWTNIRFRNQTGKFWDIAESPADELRFYTGTGNVDVMTMTAAGNIGIGTLLPSGRLHVHTGDLTRADFSTASESSPVFLRFFYKSNIQGGAVGFDSDENLLKLIHGGNFNTSTKGMVISSNGNVGVNVADPLEKLQVNGTVYSSNGGFKFPDGSVQTSAAGVHSSNYTEFVSLNKGDVTVSTNWTKLKTANTTHSFTKNFADSKIEVYVNSRMKLDFYLNASGLRIKVIVDAATEPDFGNFGSIRSPQTDEFLSIYTVFENLNAGTHTISLWGKANSGSVTGVGVDPGGWGGKIMIKETW